jgi:hypothetical protein
MPSDCDDDHHLYAWTPRAFANLASELGFYAHQIEVPDFGYDRFVAEIAARLGLGIRTALLLKYIANRLRPVKEIVFRLTCIEQDADGI